MLLGISSVQAQTSKECRAVIETYLNDMEKVATPKAGQVYHMRYSTQTVFFENYNIPKTNTQTDMMISHQKIAMNDESMKVYGDEKDMFVVLPKVQKIYWNNSDPKVFAQTNSYQKFLEVERNLLKSARNVSCSSDGNITRIVIVPGQDFEKNMGLIKQLIDFDTTQKRVVRVENRFNKKSKIKTQVVSYDILDYKSKKNIKEPSSYIFKGANLIPAYRNFEIVDNRKNKQ